MGTCELNLARSPPYPTGKDTQDLAWKIPVGNRTCAYGKESSDPEAAAEELHSSYSLLLEEFATIAVRFVTETSITSPEEAFEAAQREKYGEHSSHALLYMYFS